MIIRVLSHQGSPSVCPDCGTLPTRVPPLVHRAPWLCRCDNTAFPFSILWPSWCVGVPNERWASSKLVWRVHGSGGLFRGSPLIRRMWRQIAVTFGPVSQGRRVQMIEDTRRSRVLDKEEVAVLHCCLGGESGGTRAGAQRRSPHSCSHPTIENEIPYLRTWSRALASNFIILFITFFQPFFGVWTCLGYLCEKPHRLRANGAAYWWKEQVETLQEHPWPRAKIRSSRKCGDRDQRTYFRRDQRMWGSLIRLWGSSAIKQEGWS